MLDSLAMTRSFASLQHGTALHEEIVGALGEIHTDNWALSTMLVEALDAYGLIESPYDEELVRMQVDEALSRPQDHDVRELAYTIVSNQFEDVVGAPWFFVVDGWTDQRIILYTLASLGSPHYAFWNDWLLERLVESGDPRAPPAFERWATRLHTDTPSHQEAARCYALAVRGWAQLQPDPPSLADVGKGTHTPPGSTMQRSSSGFTVLAPARPRPWCEPHWRHLGGLLLHAAADPLYQLETPASLQVKKSHPRWPGSCAPSPMR